MKSRHIKDDHFGNKTVLSTEGFKLFTGIRQKNENK